MRRLNLAAVCLVAAALATAGLLAGVLLPAALVLPAHAQSTQGQPAVERVIVLGIDGVDHQMLTEWMDEGWLPNFARLRETGDFKPLTTSMPPQSPVAWSNFITGLDSGGHGVFDFIHRDPKTYLPFSSMSEVAPPAEHMSILGIKFPNKIHLPFSDYILPLTGGSIENLRKGTAFWQILGKHGIPAVIHRVPVNFPPVGDGAVTLSGMGTPDIQGTNGTYAYYTNDPPPDHESATGGKIFLVDVIDGVVHGKLYGPPNDFIDYDRIKRRTGRRVSYQEQKASIPFTVYVDEENPVAKIVIDGQEIFLEEGIFSPWVEVNFSLLPTPGFIRWAWHDLVSVKGTVRFYLKEAHPHFGLYVTPIQISPLNPALPITTPPEYAAELAAALGPYYTQGMPEDTKALEKDVFDNADFMKQAGIIIDEERRMAEYELARLEKGFIFLYFSSVDQVGHAMWRTMAGEEDHPAYAGGLDDSFKDVYPDLYKKLDGVVGLAMRYVDDKTCLIVMSDHGFATWRRSFDLNCWLYENGYLAVRPGTDIASVEYLIGIDWSNTSLYGIGINGLYVNQLGRERHGIVPPGPEKERLMREVAEKLEAVIDPVTGERPILKVFLNEEIYSGPYADMGPDAQMGYNRGYRASDDTAVGEITNTVLSDNTRRWSGDHCLDYRVVPGIILSNFDIRHPDPALTDLAPTILALFGIEPTPEMKGRPVF
jgi:predicted AlkP superfamily phosphohydrolase/phosphomutase